MNNKNLGETWKVQENSFPNASITFDKFHVMKLMNEAVDKVRREEQSHNALLKRTRYIWLKKSREPHSQSE